MIKFLLLSGSGLAGHRALNPSVVGSNPTFRSLFHRRPIAQLAEQRTYNPEVERSNRSGPAFSSSVSKTVDKV